MQELLNNINNESLLPSQQGLNLTSFLRTIKRKALPLAGIVGIVGAISWYNTSSISTYTGDFQILVEPVTSEAKSSEPSTLTSSTKGGNISPLEMDYSTIITILKSPGILSSIVERVQTKYPSFSLEELKTNLKIERLALSEEDLGERTKIIEISYQASDHKLVKLVLEETAKTYLNYSLEDRKTRISQGVEFIEQQLPKLHDRVGILQTKLQNLQEQNEFIDPELKGEDVLKQVRDTNVQQLETQGQLLKLTALKQNLQQQLKLTPDEAIIVSTLSEDPNYRNLLAKFKTVESEISTEAARFQTASPNIQMLYDKRQNLLNLLDRETQRILGQKFIGKVHNYPSLELQNSITLEMVQQLVETTNQLTVIETQANSLKIKKNKLEQQARQLPKVSRQYTDLKQELTITTKTLDQLVTQRDALRIELAQSQVPWEIISSPQLLSDSTGNPTPLPKDSEKKLLVSLIGSLVLGIGTTLVVEKSRDIFYAPEDIEEKIKLPMLGLIPWDKNSKESANFSTNNDINNSRFIDAFDALYANIKFRFTEPTIRSLVISSAATEDGKSTIALTLAKTSAAMGHKVLLVDANLRCPSIHHKLGLANQQGLNDLLADPMNSNCHDLIQRDPQRSNLFVLTSGQLLPDSTRMLASNRMQSLNQEFEEMFDLVIYDTPSLLDCMDTSFLAAHTDGILMVVAVGKTPKSLVMKALEQIETFNLKTLGIVGTI
jgi:capsular exopolysaccharide synthesis family protein